MLRDLVRGVFDQEIQIRAPLATKLEGPAPINVEPGADKPSAIVQAAIAQEVAKENVIELAEQLEQVSGEEVVPSFRDEAGSFSTALAPVGNATEREELVRMTEDGEEEVVVLLQPARGEPGRDRIGQAARTGQVAGQLVGLPRELDALQTFGNGHVRIGHRRDHVLELVLRAVGDDVLDAAQREQEDVRVPARNPLDGLSEALHESVDGQHGGPELRRPPYGSRRPRRAHPLPRIPSLGCGPRPGTDRR